MHLPHAGALFSGAKGLVRLRNGVRGVGCQDAQVDQVLSDVA